MKIWVTRHGQTDLNAKKLMQGRSDIPLNEKGIMQAKAARELIGDIKFDAVLCSEMQEKRPYKYKFLCWGKNKVIAMDKWARDNKIIPNVVRAYSDSACDMPLMEIAKEQVWIDRKTGLRK